MEQKEAFKRLIISSIAGILTIFGIIAAGTYVVQNISFELFSTIFNYCIIIIGIIIAIIQYLLWYDFIKEFKNKLLIKIKNLIELIAEGEDEDY
ncbi:membrane protein DedA with SNARE-associated domain [Methanococcus voltae]|uniref:Membrane protein DedA with SNARE-associated domain n=1 Tax=Methanococcus voltae TaxID=2188 RepID=A0A8J7UU07_METVO|nr:hypothetical protein [Methanococcus voltae]MBP2202223.1 membrane protein DedA with SNARE-associated domain [Methanococcus voltae]